MLSPVLITLLLLAPRLTSPEFGLLDDGYTILAARQVSRHPGLSLTLNSDSGRFLPTYWLYQTAVYVMGWAQPVVFFAANWCLLALSAGLLVWLVRLRGGSLLQAVASGMAFVLSGAVVENYYTLSKAEPVQVAFLLAALVAVQLTVRAQAPSWQLGLFAAAILGFLAAIGAKETAIIMIPVSLAWLAVSRLRLAAKDDPPDRAARRVCVAAVMLAGLAYLLLRYAFVAKTVAAGSYTRAYQFEGSRLLASGVAWAVWLVRDFPYLFPLGLLVLWSFRRKEQPEGRLLADMLIWMGGWVAVFLPWQSALEYYLLPFTVGCSVFCGVAFGQLWMRAQNRPHTRWLRAAVVATVVLFGITQLNNFTAARFQLTVDSANARLVEYLAGLPRNSKVEINLPQPNEYVYELGVHLSELKRRPDLVPDYFKFGVPAAGSRALAYYVATPVFENQAMPLPRYAVHESGARVWSEALQAFAGRSGELVYETTQRVQLADVGLQQFLCLFARNGIDCMARRPVLDTRRLVAGWKVYRITTSVERMDLPAMFRPDGVWVLQLPSGAIREFRFGQPGDLPLAGDWDGDGRSDIAIFRSSTLTWLLDRNLDGVADLQFTFPGMRQGDIPVAGDWDGDGTASPGYFRPSDVSWHFSNSFTGKPEDWPEIRLGMPGDVPLAGDWDGDGRTGVGIYRKTSGEVTLTNRLTQKSESITFGVGANQSVAVGDWSGLGIQSLALVSGGTWSPRLNCNCSPSNPPAGLAFNPSAGVPLAGKWRSR